MVPSPIVDKSVQPLLQVIIVCVICYMSQTNTNSKSESQLESEINLFVHF